MNDINQDITKKQLKQISRFLKRNLNISGNSFSEKKDGYLSPTGLKEAANEHGINLHTMFEEVADKQKAANREMLRHMGMILAGTVMTGLGFTAALMGLPNVGGAIMCVGLLAGLATILAPTPEADQARATAEDSLYALTDGAEIAGRRFLKPQPSY